MDDFSSVGEASKVGRGDGEFVWKIPWESDLVDFDDVTRILIFEHADDTYDF